jgi:hypothetical protein
MSGDWLTGRGIDRTLDASNCALAVTVNDQRSTLFRRILCVAGIAVTIQACAPLAVNESRAGASSLGCMQSAIAKNSLTGRPDDEAHCMAAGIIALHCSATEAWLASYGKELRDLFGGGDAEWRDLQSDWRGIQCARSATTESGLIKCCSNSP